MLAPLSPPAADLLAAARPASPGAPGQGVEAARQVARDFEAMALSQLFQSMFSGLETDGLFGGGAGEQAFRPLLVDEYARATAKAGGIGIADSVLAEIIRMQTAPGGP
jgi:flagellar protein FlgJ